MSYHSQTPSAALLLRVDACHTLVPLLVHASAHTKALHAGAWRVTHSASQSCWGWLRAPASRPTPAT